ncbi:selenoprotein N, partial [Tachysurus ichikawai]
MAEDVDKTAPLQEEDEEKAVNNHGTGRTRRIWALFMIACAPVIGAVIQYVRNTQISERH